MNISVLGTGMVGRALAAKLQALGHDVAIGTRDVESTRSRLLADPETLSAWRAQTQGIPLVSFPEAGARADVVLNATAGIHSLAALDAVGTENLAGKIILDLAIPLDLSNGLPPTLTIANDDSLGEQIQRAHPEARVVKSLHTMYYEVMVDPGQLAGPHNVFVGGNDADAKSVVAGLLHEMGWPEAAVVDLGDITSSRATEMYSRLFFALYAQRGAFNFNTAIVSAPTGTGQEL